MSYIDTSVLAAYYSPESASSKAQQAISKNIPVISSLTEVELYSAISRKVQSKELAAQDGHRILALFQSHLEMPVYKKLPVERRHYQLARDWIGQMRVPLRTLDALHLALCSLENLSLVTADKGFAKAAKIFHVPVLLVS